MCKVIFGIQKMEMEDSFMSESSTFQVVPSSSASHPKFVKNVLCSENSLPTTGKRRRSWPPGSPKAQSLSDNHGIFVTYDNTADDDEDAIIYSDKNYLPNIFHHDGITATRSLTSRIPKLRGVKGYDRARSFRKSRKKFNRIVAEREALFKALVHVDGDNNSNTLASEASRGGGEAVSTGGESGNSNYRPFDDIVIEGHSGGSIRALAVEAAFVANGILRRSGQQGKEFRHIIEKFIRLAAL